MQLMQLSKVSVQRNECFWKLQTIKSSTAEVLEFVEVNSMFTQEDNAQLCGKGPCCCYNAYMLFLQNVFLYEQHDAATPGV